MPGLDCSLLPFSPRRIPRVVASLLLSAPARSFLTRHFLCLRIEKGPALTFTGVTENPPPASRFTRTAAGSFFPGFIRRHATTAAFTLRRFAPARLALARRCVFVISPHRLRRRRPR